MTSIHGSVVYEGIGDSLERALRRAHDQIPQHEGRDYTISRVIEWGMQRGGFTEAHRIWVRLVEDSNAPFKPDP